jgi:hypothetical protein
MNKKWVYFARDEEDLKFESLPLHIGTYESSPQFKIDSVIHGTTKSFLSDKNVQWIKKPTYLYSAGN